MGIVLRIVAYADNRCLWTDEVSLALNIAELNFQELAQPLGYQQYAPPVFMWLVKTSSMVFGMGEQALRLYPLVTGILSLFFTASLLRKYVSATAAWYPLMLLATGMFYIKYSTELKQYMPDAFIAVALIWLAHKMDIAKTSRNRFGIIWVVTGSIVIWSSMPSVFVLAGVGCYYGLYCLQQRNYKSLTLLSSIIAIWLLQFSYYYHTILSHQIGSDFLLSYHNRYFLAVDNWAKNKIILTDILQDTYGESPVILSSNIILLIIGILTVLIKPKRAYLLITLPIVLMLTAGLLQQYSLIPRLTLFAMPMLLIIAGIGLQQLLPKLLVIRIPIIVMMILAIIFNKPIQILHSPIKEEQITEALDYLVSEQITSEELYVYSGAVNSFRYYTTLHPKKSKWQQLRNAKFIQENTNIETTAASQQDTIALLYTIPFDSYYTRSVFEKHSNLVKTFQATGCSVFIFNKN